MDHFMLITQHGLLSHVLHQQEIQIQYCEDKKENSTTNPDSKYSDPSHVFGSFEPDFFLTCITAFHNFLSWIYIDLSLLNTF